jgi:hypothetical protein
MVAFASWKVENKEVFIFELFFCVKFSPKIPRMHVDTDKFKHFDLCHQLITLLQATYYDLLLVSRDLLFIFQTSFSKFNILFSVRRDKCRPQKKKSFEPTSQQ